ncbi:MAG: hypothetical protein R3D03_11060 [Geminicoccaceae bacterium]
MVEALRLDSRTAGALDWFFTYRSTITSTTGLEAGRPVTTRFAASRAFNDEQDWSLTFDAAGRILQARYPRKSPPSTNQFHRSCSTVPTRSPLPSMRSPASVRASTCRRHLRRQARPAAGHRLRRRTRAGGASPETPQQPALACRIGGELLAGARKDGDDDEEDERTGETDRHGPARRQSHPGYAIPAIIQAGVAGAPSSRGSSR